MRKAVINGSAQVELGSFQVPRSTRLLLLGMCTPNAMYVAVDRAEETPRWRGRSASKAIFPQ